MTQIVYLKPLRSQKAVRNEQARGFTVRGVRAIRIASADQAAPVPSLKEMEI